MQIFDHDMVFEKNADFLAENCQKSQKIVIMYNIDPRFGLKSGFIRPGDPIVAVRDADHDVVTA
jgi:hypothetical protein